MEIEVALDAHATIAESPVWSPAEGVLYWIDIKEPALHRFDPATGQDQSWQLSSDVGAFALLEAGGALVALRYGIHRLDFATGALTRLAEPPYDPRLFRFNEGACDGSGRFWVGVMFDPLEGSPPQQKGALHSFTLDGGLRREPDEAELHNGLAWRAGGRSLLLSHSNARAIYEYDFDPAEGRIGEGRLFAEIPEALGIPDGAAFDAEGGYWCALHGGGKLRRFAPDGSVDRDIDLPVSQPTMCAFAGDAFDELYVTSASDKMSDEEKQAEPLAGAILRLRPGVRGLPCHRPAR